MTIKELKEAILKEIDEQIIIWQEIVALAKKNIDNILKVWMPKESQDNLKESLDERNKELLELTQMRKGIDESIDIGDWKNENAIQLLILFQRKRITIEKQKQYLFRLDDLIGMQVELIWIRDCAVDWMNTIKDDAISWFKWIKKDIKNFRWFLKNK